MSESVLQNELKEARRARDLTQGDLARAAGISRQAYGSIERGGAVPSLSVALRLAEALGGSVERLFHLESSAAAPLHVWSPASPTGQRVRVASVGGRRVTVPADGIGGAGPSLASGVLEAGGSGTKTARIRSLPGAEGDPDLVLVGCDPASALIQALLRDRADVDMVWVPSGSRRALEALGEGLAHVAGFHLRDASGVGAATSDVQRRLPFRVTVVGFAVWEVGLMLRPGNPLGVESVSDLARPDLRFLNREMGSGSRALVDRSLAEAGIPGSAIPGYEDSAATGHWAVAQAVASGAVDAGVGIRAAATAFGLTWVPLESERYDLVIPDHLLRAPGVAALMDLLESPGLRAQVEALGGYDVEPMGQPA
ncbi:MAG: helix-turn-helix domain-containing protein [Gemmatimonadetes bacterium]|nr:helix-turn-helix domain-containing protein [Gemmatimonadota bacterium]